MADDEEIIVNFRGDASGLTTAAGQAAGALQKVGQTGSAAAYLARDAILDLSHVARDLPYAASNINILVGPLGKIQTLFFDLKAQTGSVQGAFQALGSQLMGGGGLLIGVELITVAISTFGKTLFQSSEKVNEAAEAIKRYTDARKDAIGDVVKEEVKVQSLIAVLKSEHIVRTEKLAALKELKQINPEIFGQLKLEGDAVIGLTQAYKDYVSNIKTVVAAKLVQTQLEDVSTKLAKLEGEDLTASQKKVVEAIRNTNQERMKQQERMGDASPLRALENAQDAKKNELLKQQAELMERLGEFAKGIHVGGIKPEQGEKSSFEFFNHFFDFDPNAINLSAKRTYQLFQIAFDFAAKENRNFKGLDAILGAKDQNAALDAARIWWSNFEKGIVQFQIPSININEALKLVPHIANDPSQHYLNEYLEGQKNLFAKSEGVLPFLDPSNIDRGALILKYQLLFKSIGKDLPNLLEYQDENGQRVKAPISQLTNIKQLQEALSKVYKEANSQTDVLGQKISGVLAPAFQSLFSAIIAGQNPLKSFFQAIGQQVEQLLQQLIAAAVEAFVISAITGGGTSFGSAFGKLTGINIGKHASGGVAYGPSLGLIGEYANAGSNPEIIAPLSKLKSLLGSTGGAQGGEFIARGSDLILVQNRTQRMQRRTT